MKLPLNAKWKEVHDNLAPLPTQNGLYVLHERVTDMWTRFNYEHPALIGTYGMLPGDGVDRNVLAKTLAQIGEKWQFDRVWGWDFPMLAMAAAKLNRPEQAVDYLLHPSPNFEFDDKGLATGGPFPYFPSNGGLLYAVGFMAGGWDGAPKRVAAGFPASWKVRAEGFAVAP